MLASPTELKGCRVQGSDGDLGTRSIGILRECYDRYARQPSWEGGCIGVGGFVKRRDSDAPNQSNAYLRGRAARSSKNSGCTWRDGCPGR